MNRQSFSDPSEDFVDGRSNSGKMLLILGGIAAVFFCLVGLFVISSLTMGWFFMADQVAVAPPSPTATPVTPSQLAAVLALPTPIPVTPTPIPSPTPTETPTATPTETAIPTDTPTATAPPTETPTSPPTATLPPPPPTNTPAPEPTPTPAFRFVVLETSVFPTTHLNFDLYVAITDPNNRPISGYRVVGTHSSGLQVTSNGSAAEWTVNSGAMHYKAGNIKFEAFNAPGGPWTFQLIDEAGQPVAQLLELAFDPANPTWYFVLYRQTS